MAVIIIFLEKIVTYSEKKDGTTEGEFELHESYFGVQRIRGKRGRGAAGKTPVFGMGRKSAFSVVENCSKE